MIRKTLAETKAATYAILLPSTDPAHGGMPLARGTGFFIDGQGHFLTADHVVAGQQVERAWLMQSGGPGGFAPMLQHPKVIQDWPEYDLALLRLDFDLSSTKEHLQGLTEFPHIPIGTEQQEEGSAVYAHGYPLPVNTPPLQVGGTMFGHVGLAHRTTSAIISSTRETSKFAETGHDARVYVLDKALNYGNSGGPVVATGTGKAFAVCTRFQSVLVPQAAGGVVMVPSLYGVATSMANIAGDLEGLSP